MTHEGAPEAGRPALLERGLLVSCALLFALLLAPVYGDSENRAHALMWSLYERGSIDITGAPFPTGDVVHVDGRAHSAGTPGLAFVGLLAYAPVRWVSGSLLGLGQAELLGYLAAVAFAAAGPALLGVWALGRLSPQRRTEATLAFALGTPLLAYAGRFMVHACVLGALTAALLAVERALRAERDAWRPAALAGLATGLATFVDYPAALACVALGALLVLAPGPRLERGAAYAAGAIGPILILMAYHQAAFGGPFTTSYAVWWSQQDVSPQAVGWVGYTGPRPAVIAELLIGPRVGLLIYCLPALAGLWGAARVLRRDRLEAPLALVCLGLFAAYFALNACRPLDWHAAHGHGPRYLFVGLPFALRYLDDGFASWPRPAVLGVLAISLLVGWLGAQSVTHVWDLREGAPVWTRAADVAAAGPRLPLLYVTARSFGVPAPGYVGICSAAALGLLGGAGWAWWRGRETTVAAVGLSLAAVSILHLL